MISILGEAGRQRLETGDLMGYVEGLPQLPILALADGSEFVIYRMTPLYKNGVKHIRIILEPFQWTKAMLKIDDKMLNYKISEYGTLEKTYPASFLLNVSQNPEKPVWWGFFTFDGNLMTPKTDKVAAIMSMMEENNNLQKILDLKNKEIEQLREDNEKLIIRSRSHFETHENLMKKRSLLPIDTGEEFELKTRTKQER